MAHSSTESKHSLACICSNAGYRLNDNVMLSSRKRSRRARRRSLINARRREENALLYDVMEQQAQFREQILQQQRNIDQLKEQIETFHALPGKIYDGLDYAASGFGAIQNRLGEVHQQRPRGGLRYAGL